MGFHFGKATGVFMKTLPFIALRLAVGAAFGLLAVVYFGVVGYVLLNVMDSYSNIIALVGLVLAGLLFMGFVKLLRRYVLYLVSAAHVAVIAHIIDTGEVPENQLAFGKQQLTDRGLEVSGLFALDLLVKGAVKQFNRAVMSLSDLLAIVPALKQVVEILKRAIGMAASYLDEAIMAHMFLNEDKGNWTAARDGVVLYGKTWKSVLGSTIIIVAGLYLLTLTLFLALSPLAGVFGGFTPAFEFLGWAIVGGIVVVAYFGLLSPWVKTVVVTTFLVESANETPDSETMDFIAEKSGKFRELIEKADDENGGDTPVAADSESGAVDESSTPT